jgi:hypothetical protein
MAMVQGIQNLKDDVMINHRDGHNLHKDELRTDLCILLDELKRIGSSMVAELENFMDATIAQPALDQIPDLQDWIRRVERVKAAACALQGPQKSVPQPRKKGAGLKYIVGCNGEAPKMQAIHCAFARMAVQEMSKNGSVSGSQLVEIWNTKYAPVWSSRTSRPKGHGGKAGSGLATNFFSNQLFRMGDLRDIASGNKLYPVELTDDDNDDADADEEDDVDGDPSPACGRRECNPAKVDDEDTSRVRSGKRRRPSPPPKGTQPAAERPPKPAA